MTKVEIQTFEGDFEQWSSWYKLFEFLIHKNEVLDNMVKLSYLRSRLKGITLTLVETYPFEGDYYDSAFDAIVDHYNDPIKRISRLLDVLQNSPSVKEKKQTLRGLILLYIELMLQHYK